MESQQQAPPFKYKLILLLFSGPSRQKRLSSSLFQMYYSLAPAAPQLGEEACLVLLLLEKAFLSLNAAIM